jgi:hypothetical protein
MIQVFPAVRDSHEAMGMQVGCENRTVSKDGRIVCSKITQGDNTVSPEVCRACPARTVNCSHLRFSLSHSAHVPLLVRFNGRTEVWTDDTPELHFCNAACAERVAPVLQPRACAGCPLRSPCQATAPAAQPARSPRGNGKVVSFPTREPEPALAAG